MFCSGEHASVGHGASVEKTHGACVLRAAHQKVSASTSRHERTVGASLGVAWYLRASRSTRRSTASHAILPNVDRAWVRAHGSDS